jgi:hypothetical protein
LPYASIVNKSVGASPGSQFSCEMPTDFSVYDYVFLDTIVNDEHLSSDIGSEMLINRVMFEIAATIASQTNLVILGFCKVDYLYAPSSLFKRRIDIAVATQSQFVDVRTLVLKFGGKIVGEDPLYEHIGHPDHRIQYSIGYNIGQCIYDRSFQARHRSCYNFRDNFKVYGVADFALPDALVRRKNSVFDVLFAELFPGQSIEFETTSLCLGFYINSRDTRAILNLEGPNGIRVKELWYDLNAAGFELKFVPVIEGHLTNRIVFPATPPFERSIHTRFHKWPGTADAKLSLMKIAFWAGNKHAEFRAGSASFDFDVFHNHVDKLLEKQWS